MLFQITIRIIKKRREVCASTGCLKTRLRAQQRIDSPIIGCQIDLDFNVQKMPLILKIKYSSKLKHFLYVCIRHLQGRVALLRHGRNLILE